MQVQHDGEVPETLTPFHARVLDNAARFIVSDEGYSLFCSES